MNGEKTNTPEEIAESFINGNLSWVKNTCKESPAMVAKVFKTLKETSTEEAKRFIDLVSTW